MDYSPLKVGLTGGIATGKTTVSKLFTKLGVPIIDADVISHALVEPGQVALQLIVEAFGSDILQSNGHLNRAKLRQQIFADEQQRRRLEAILHPRIRKSMQEQIAQVRTSYCILSIPLLLESQQMDTVDRILVIDCPCKLQRQRLKRRNNLADYEIEQILAAQASREARLAIANDVIYNDISLDNLQKKVIMLHKKYHSFF